jgi:hypothetical protein
VGYHIGYVYGVSGDMVMWDGGKGVRGGGVERWRKAVTEELEELFDTMYPHASFHEILVWDRLKMLAIAFS